MCLKKLCVAFCLLLGSLPTAFAGERQGYVINDSAGGERAPGKSPEAAFPKMAKHNSVDASGFRLAVLSDAVLLRWKFENVVNFGTAVLEQSSNGQPFATISTLSMEDRAYTDNCLRPDRLYRIRMVATDGTVVVTSVLNAEGHVSAVGAAQ